MKLSIVTTLYCSEKYINEFYQRSTIQGRKIAGDDYEIIIVDDGSPDNSLQLALELLKKDSHVVVLELSRNFGHHKAMRTGLEHARGELIFLLDSDLEEEPEWLTSFYQKMLQENLDVVYGVQEKRKGGFFEKISGHIYYKILDFLLNIQHPKNITTARLMNKKYVEAFLKFTETEIIISCLWVLTGFKQKAFEVKKHFNSKSTYSFVKKISLALDTIFSFSTRPLKIIFLIGNLMTLFSLIFILKLILCKLFLLKSIDGWTSLIVSIWFIGGLLISFQGIIGIYISKIFLEVKKRPISLLRRKYLAD
jgi:putative glycosyltransferase